MKSLDILITELESGAVTSVDLVEQSFAAIDAHNADINAFLRTYKEDAVAQAQASDERRKIGQPLSHLDGVPVAIKDNFSYHGFITSAGSQILADYKAPYDATVVAKLKAAGAIIIGQANMDEFAMGSSGENSAFGATKNPLDPARVPGGSSSGSAAAVAAHMAPLAFGSDTGGSIRLPAAFCGIVGLKPTYGAVSRYGLMAMASSLDQIGPFASTVHGAKIGFDAIKGLDALDSTSQDATYLERKEKYTIGVPKQFFDEGLDPRISDSLKKVLKQREAAGHTIKEIDLPLLTEANAVYYIIVPAEVSSNLARYDGIRYGIHTSAVPQSRSQGFGDEVKRRIMLGTYALSAGYADQYYKRAQAARAGLRAQLLETFKDVDMLFGPVSPEFAFKIGAKSSDPLAMYLSDIYTVPVNLAGLPGLSLPVEWLDIDGVQLPVAAQLIGAPWSEERLFDVGQTIEKPKE